MEDIEKVLATYESKEDKISFLLTTTEHLKKSEKYWKTTANEYHKMLQDNTDDILQLQQENERFKHQVQQLEKDISFHQKMTAKYIKLKEN